MSVDQVIDGSFSGGETGFLRKITRNALRMAALWAGLGGVVGCLTTPVQSDGIVLSANIVAGIIVLTPLGAILGFLGAGRREVLITAVTGALISFGVAYAIVDAGHARAAATGLIIGAIVGATFVTMIFRIPALVIAKISGRV